MIKDNIVQIIKRKTEKSFCHNIIHFECTSSFSMSLYNIIIDVISIIVFIRENSIYETVRL